MKNIYKVLIATLFVGVTANTSLAAEGEKYAVFDLGQVSVPDLCKGSGFSCDTTSMGYRFGMGYQVNPNIGVEVGYITGISMEAKSVSAEATASGIHFAAIAAMPLDEKSEVFGKLGMANIVAEASGGGLSVSHDNSNMTFGFGARYFLDEQISIRVSYEDFGTMTVDTSLDGSKVSYFSAGLLYKF